MDLLQQIRDRLSRLDFRLEESVMLRSVRKALVLSIPFLLIGSLALILISLPVPGYQERMTAVLGVNWRAFGQSLINGTFGMQSLIMGLAVSHSYASECNDLGGEYANPMITALVALSALLSLSGAASRGLSESSFGSQGMFAAILVPLLAARLFMGLSRSRRLRLRALTDGANASFCDAVSAIPAALLTVSLFAGFGFILFGLFGVGSIQELLVSPFLALFRVLGHTLGGGLGFILLVHLLWMFGIHGSDVLEPVARGLFEPALAVNQQLVANHLPPVHIFTKTFFDVFVLMGGSGATLCLVLAILLHGRQKNLRRHAAFSSLPVLFNVNELIVFGIPIVLNPVYLIPFVGTPLLLTLVSCAAIATGLVPYTTRMVEWTTPVLLGGYAATGSFAGSALQAFNLGLGVLCYLPFVRIADHQSEARMRRTLVRIAQAIADPARANDKRGLVTRHDDLGMAARALAGDLRHDLDRGRLELHYQPQFDDLGKITGLEALLRWKHERYGSIPPPVAIALAEASNQFERLDAWVLDTACRQLRDLQDQGIDGVTVSFNTTAPRLEGGAVCENLKRAIARYRIPPAALKVEITEQDALSATRSAVERMNEVRALGVKLAMDDFGMGATSILYLQECIFDTVKIDGSLVKGLMNNPVCSEIIGSIVRLGHTLSFSVIAEFVETEAQRDQLVRLGCRQFQGYLYSPGLAFGELPGFIRDWRERQADGVGLGA
jgi:lactose/cellobiose-specific phosphotransferase system IIC component